MSVKTIKDVTAGTVGGISVVAVGHPFDTLKVRLQTQSVTKPVYGARPPRPVPPRPRREGSRLAVSWCAAEGRSTDPPLSLGGPRRADGMVDCFQKTVKWEGLGGLYKGFMSPLVGQMLFRASLFGAFGASKSYLSENGTKKLDAVDFFKAGAMTGFAASFTESPIDFYKSQLQVQMVKQKADPKYVPAYTGLWDCITKSVKVNGVMGPFTGLGATILRNTPANAVYLGSFEVFKQMFADRLKCKQADLPMSAVFLSGGFGGTLYWVAIFPLDVLKSTIQSDALAASEKVYGTTMSQAAATLYKEGGVGRFYKGFAPCLLRSVPANGTMLLVVDKVANYLHSQ